MSKSKLFQYAIIWHPTEKQVKDDGAKSKLAKELTTILATDEKAVLMTASMNIPVEYKEQLDQVEIVVRPF
jgi:hypothetical protein